MPNPETAIYTAGPWRVDGATVIASDPRGTIVAEVTGSPSNSTTRADAALIAAAPDLLAALRFFANPPTPNEHAWKRARQAALAAIAKAEGK